LIVPMHISDNAGTRFARCVLHFASIAALHA
jgi:hypothetical protein